MKRLEPNVIAAGAISTSFLSFWVSACSHLAQEEEFVPQAIKTGLSAFASAAISVNTFFVLAASASLAVSLSKNWRASDGMAIFAAFQFAGLMMATFGSVFHERFHFLQGLAMMFISSDSAFGPSLRKFSQWATGYTPCWGAHQQYATTMVVMPFIKVKRCEFEGLGSDKDKA